MTIIWASRNGCFEIVKLLIQNGVNINNKDYYNDTPLIYASRNGHFEIVKLLIQNGANINDKNQDNYIALYYAVKNKHIEIAKLLIDNDSDNILDKIPDENPIKEELISYINAKEPIFK
jgi:ankyrin repeat protein